MTVRSRYMLLGEPKAVHLTASELQSKSLTTHAQNLQQEMD